MDCVTSEKPDFGTGEKVKKPSCALTNYESRLYFEVHRGELEEWATMCHKGDALHAV